MGQDRTLGEHFSEYGILKIIELEKIIVNITPFSKSSIYYTI